MKKFLSIIILIALTLSVVACSAKNIETPNTTDADTDTEETAIPQTGVPGVKYEADSLASSLDFGGQTVSILTVDGTIFMASDFSVEAFTGDRIYDSLYQRELYVEERLGVEIETSRARDYKKEVEKHINADEDTYQLYDLPTSELSGYIFNNYLTDLKTVKHLDFERPWWPQHTIKNIELKGKMFFATGTVSLSLLRGVYGVYFNSRLIESEKGMQPSDLYAIVDSGEWTYDKLLELGRGIYRDLNANSKKDTSDFYGMGFPTGGPVDTAFSCFDIDILSRTDDGWVEFSMDTDKYVDVYKKLHKLFFFTEGCLSREYSGDVFTEGNLMFDVNSLGSAESLAFSKMEDRYGILPMPKYDTVQTEYYTGSQEGYFSFAIPITTKNPDMAGAVLEALASYSYRATTPTYCDVVLKGAYMNDVQARAAMDTLINGISIDTATLYMHTVGASFVFDIRNYLNSELNVDYLEELNLRLNSLNSDLKAYKILYGRG